MKLYKWAIAFLLMAICWICPGGTMGLSRGAIAAPLQIPPAPTAQESIAQDPMAQRIAALLETRSCIGCNLQGADLRNADLRGVNLTRANLKQANLSGAKMIAVVLKEADLQGAMLNDADILVVDLTQANLKNATVKSDLRQARLCHTISPDGSLSNRDC